MIDLTTRHPSRKIIHVDMDAFFVAIEMREDSSLRQRCVAVGGQPQTRGVIATANYQARQFGVHSALSSAQAKLRCPDLIILPPNFPLYRQVSEQIREIFYQTTDQVEPVSIDEAYLDVSQVMNCQGSATLIAQSLLKTIYEQTQLTASAGVSYNKFLAKIASNINKPAGICTIRPDEAKTFINQLPIAKFHGIGPATASKLHALGIFHGRDIRQHSIKLLRRSLGKMADFLYQLAEGDDPREIKTEQVRKSIGSEQTFVHDTLDETVLRQAIYEQIERCFASLIRQQQCAQTLTVKIKYANFKQQTRSYTHKVGIHDALFAQTIAEQLLNQFKPLPPIRLIGISLSGLISHAQRPQQLPLF